MKQLAFSLLALALTATLQLKAENTDISAIGNVVYMEPVSFPAGSQQTLSIKMKNTVGIQTVQFDMVLPEGVTIVKDEDDFELISLSTARTTTKKMDSFSAAFISGTRYRVLINSNNGYTFDGTDGEIVQVVVNIDASVANSSLPFVFEDIVLVDTGSNGFETERVETTITVTEQEDTRVILDETSTSVPEASSGEVEILVKRTLKANQWSTICLPFDMTEAQTREVFGSDVQLAEFTDYDIECDDDDNIIALNVNFGETDLSEGFYGNNPYLIKTSKGITEFEVTAAIDPNEEDAVVEYDNGKTGKRREVYGSFIGTYHAGDVIPACGLFLSNNKFYYSTGKTLLKAFRGYFQFKDVLTSVENIANVKFAFFLDGTTTHVEDLAPVTTEDTIYDLSGRKVTKPQQSGVYIVNGKKAVIK